MQWKGCKLLQNTEEELSVMEIESEHPVILLVDATQSSNDAIMLVWSGCVQNGTSLFFNNVTRVFVVPTVNNQN